MLLATLPIVWAIFDFANMTLQDQLVARATHNAAQAAGREPQNCENAVERVLYPTRGVLFWVLNNNKIGASAGTITPDELDYTITADNGDLGDGVDFNRPGCGTPGSWIEVRATVPTTIATIQFDREYTGWSIHEP